MVRGGARRDVFFLFFFLGWGWLVFVEGDLFLLFPVCKPPVRGGAFLFFSKMRNGMTHPWVFDKPVLGKVDFLNTPANG